MSSNFKVTTAGLAAATTAGSGGPKIDIVQFKLGSAFNYTPGAGDTGLNGSTVYTGVPSSVAPYSSDTVDITLTIPANVGPFSFGEIGIYMPSNVLFAKMAYTTLQEKLSDAANGVGAVWSIHALMKLSDATALFNFNFLDVGDIPIIDAPAVDGPNSIGLTVNAIIATVRNPQSTTVDTSVLLIRQSATQWQPQGYNYLGTFTTDAGTNTTTVVDPAFNTGGTAERGTPVRRYLLQNAGGQIVEATSNGDGTATLWTTTAWMTSGLVLTLWDYQDDQNQNFTSPWRRDTLAQDDNTKNLISSAWYQLQIGTTLPLMDGTATAGASPRWASSTHRHPTDTTRAPVNNPTFTGIANYLANIGGAPQTFEIGFRGTPWVVGSPSTSDPSQNGCVIANVAPSNGGSGMFSVIPGMTSGWTAAVLNNCSNGTDNITIGQGGGMTMKWVGVGLTGSRTLAPTGMAWILVEPGGAHAWISGTGLS